MKSFQKTPNLNPQRADDSMINKLNSEPLHLPPIKVAENKIKYLRFT